jgi:hypothetical protein
MRKFAYIICAFSICLLSVTFVSCGKKEKEKPEIASEADVKEAEEKTEEFFEAIEEHDFEKAQTYVTVETRPVLEAVIADTKKYKEKEGKAPEIKIEIIDRKPLIGRVDLQVKIVVGEKVKKETIQVVQVEDEWLVVMPRKQLAVLKFIAFQSRYDLIIINVKQEKHRHSDDCKHHHKKHKHHHGHGDDH